MPAAALVPKRRSSGDLRESAGTGVADSQMSVSANGNAELDGNGCRSTRPRSESCAGSGSAKRARRSRGFGPATDRREGQRYYLSLHRPDADSVGRTDADVANETPRVLRMRRLATERKIFFVKASEQDETANVAGITVFVAAGKLLDPRYRTFVKQIRLPAFAIVDPETQRLEELSVNDEMRGLGVGTRFLKLLKSTHFPDLWADAADRDRWMQAVGPKGHRLVGGHPPE